LVVAYTLLHIVTHFAFGGLSQLIRVVRPSAIPAGNPALAAADEDAPAQLRPIFSRRANIMASTGAAGLAVATGFFYVDHCPATRCTFNILRNRRHRD
jgi:hypothetical protein